MPWHKIPYPQFQQLALPHLKARRHRNYMILRAAGNAAPFETPAFHWAGNDAPPAFTTLRKKEWVLSEGCQTRAEDLIHLWEQENTLPLNLTGLQEEAAAIAHLLPAIQRTLKIATNYYEMDTLQSPPPISGRLYRATATDAPAYAPLYAAFIQEAMHQTLAPEVVAAEALRTLQEREVLLFERDNQAVATALSMNVADVGRNIGGVYTLPAYRGRGIGATLVAHLTAQGLAEGRFVALLADQSLAHTNKLYQRLGFREKAQYQSWSFSYELTSA